MFLVLLCAQLPRFDALPLKAAGLGVERYRFYESVASGLYKLDDDFDNLSLSSLGESGGLAKAFFPAGSARKMYLFQQEDGRYRLTCFLLRERKPHLVWQTRLELTKTQTSSSGTLGRDRARNLMSVPASAPKNVKLDVASNTPLAGYWTSKIGGWTCVFLTPKGEIRDSTLEPDPPKLFPLTRAETRYLRR